jgi:hypothetical protein
MTIDELRAGIFWRMCRSGVYMGVICGAVYGTILVPVFGTIVGAIIGGGMGFVIGILNGWYLSSVTADHYYPLLDFDQYRQTTSVQAGLFSALSVVIIMGLILYIWLDYKPFEAATPCVIVPALVGGAAAVLATRRVTSWYSSYVGGVPTRLMPRDDWA